MDAPITLVSGLPRSGTSLVMRVLEAAGIPPLTDGIRAADADNPHGYYELEAVKGTAADPSWLDRAPGHAVKVVLPLLAALPRDRRYRVLLLRRDLAEVIRSQDAMLARGGGPLESVEPAVLERVFSRQLRDATTLLESHTCFDWLAVDHARLVSEPEAALGRIARFLGLEADPAGLAGLVDPALHRQR